MNDREWKGAGEWERKGNENIKLKEKEEGLGKGFKKRLGKEGKKKRGKGKYRKKYEKKKN